MASIFTECGGKQKWEEYESVCVGGGVLLQLF